MFLFKRSCLETVQQLHEYVAADCPTISNGFVYTCTPSASNVNINRYEISSGLSVDYLHVLEHVPCNVDVVSIAELSWLVVLVWIAAYGIKAAIKVVRS